MQSIDTKIATEMNELREKMNKMNEELRMFGEIENIKLQFEGTKEVVYCKVSKFTNCRNCLLRSKVSSNEKNF